jgi:REP element-mobilizing transposase RayT
MANTYTQIHIHYVFAPKYREAILDQSWRPELFAYITGVVHNNGHKVLQINGMADHVHLFIGLRPTQFVADLIKQVKEDSSGWINKKRFVPQYFNWQEGYGAFSHSKSQVQKVVKYIQEQEEHHAKISFLEEYVDMLKKFGIAFDERYIFKALE